MKRIRKRLLFLMAGIVGGILVGFTTGCTPDPKKETDPPIGSAPLLTFSVHTEAYIAAPQQMDLPADTPLSSALDHLGKHLSKNYFSKSGQPEPRSLRFVVRAITFVPGGEHPLRVATIDMIDPNQSALVDFFQGSTGAQCTFYLVASTFLQPQRDPPLLNGLLLLYNGKPFPVMDHVQLTEIVVPEQVRWTVLRALRLSAASHTIRNAVQAQ